MTDWSYGNSNFRSLIIIYLINDIHYCMDSNNDDDTSSASGGESSANYMISESGKQSEDKGKKSGFDAITDKVKDKVTGAGSSVKEGLSGLTGNDSAGSDTASDLDSAQTRQRSIGEADSDPSTTGPTENLRQKAASTTSEDDSEEPA